MGAARGRPGGAPPAWVWGVRGRALSHPQMPALWAGCRGPLPGGCGCGGVRAWGPVTNPTARALAFCGGGLRVPGGGASCLGVGRPGSGALPPPTARSLGGLPVPTTNWLWVRGDAGVGTRHQPHRARSCELALRAVGAARGRPGGAPPAWVWGVRGRALSHPQLPALWAGCRGPLPTGCGCGGVRAWGPVTNPTARALACCGGGLRVPGGGASCLGVWRPGSGALPPPTARPLGGLRGPTTHCLWVRGGAGLGTRHQPHSARSCELALRAVGAAGGRPGGAPPAWVWDVWGRALPHPPLPALWAGCRGPLPTGCGCRGGAGVGAQLSLAPCPVPRFVVCCARFPGSRHPVAVVAWHLSSCRGCGRRRASLACPVAPGWCTAPRPVRSLSVLRLAFPLPWCLPPPRGLSPPALLGGCAGHVEAGREPGSLCLPLAPAEARALGALRVVPVRGPAIGLSLAGPSGFGLGLRALRWFGVCGPGH